LAQIKGKGTQKRNFVIPKTNEIMHAKRQAGFSLIINVEKEESKRIYTFQTGDYRKQWLVSITICA
jgi:Rieske Fe-S protein